MSESEEEIPEKLKDLLEQILRGSPIREIHLAGNDIGVAGCKALAEAIKSNSTITKIDLRLNSIGDEGRQALAEAIKSNSIITHIDLATNDIGVAGCQALAEAIKSNSTITNIELGYNSFRDEGCQALAEAIKSNSTITTIKLRNNSIGDEGCKALAEAIKSNSTITKIDLADNRIRDEGCQALAEAIKSNSTITTINLRNNSIGDEQFEAIEELLATDRRQKEESSAAMTEEYVVATQQTIGTLITKPKMADKYLKRPPIRFLHDLVMEVTRTTGFAQGLYNTEESDAEQLREKGATLDFFNKAISATCFALGESIDVSASKIAAGLEPEKTNAWLVKLHQAATTCVGEKSEAAVQRVLSGELIGAVKERRQKEAREREDLKLHFDEWQRRGVAPLPVVRLCFVGQGRAGKTTTLRRLKGEAVQEGAEDSTYGVELWAGQARGDLSSSWQDCGRSMFDASAVDAIRTTKQGEKKRQPEQGRGPKPEVPMGERVQEVKELQEVKKPPDTPPPAEDAAGSTDLPKEPVRLTAPQNAEKTEPNEAIPQKLADEAAQQNAEESLGPRLMDDQLFLDMEKAGDHEEPLRPRLQCWDFPGQNVYAQCNLLYFHGRGIYLAFVDVSQELDDAWPELRFWLWAVAQYAFDDNAPARESTAAPPVLLVATKWSKKRLDEQDLDSRVDSFLDFLPRLKSQLQAGPGVSQSCRSRWVYPVENFAEDVESYITPLRERLNELAAELLLPARQDAVNKKAYAGLQSTTYPVAWLRAHDLLTGLGDGMDVTIPRAQLQAHLQRTERHSGPATAEPSMGDSDLLEPNSSFTLKSDEPMLTRIGERILVPKGARVQVLGSSDDTGDVLLLKVSCTSLGLSQVRSLLGGMKPRPIVGEDVPKVLSLLHGLGVLFWFSEEGLNENVLLAIRKVAVALTRIISLRFWAEKGLQHSETYKTELFSRVSATSRRRLNTEGFVNRDVLQKLWAEDFGQSDIQSMTNMVLKIMEHKGLVLKRAFQNDFVVPCCLPAAVVPQSAREACEVRYLNLHGLVTPSILSQTADLICKSSRGSRKLSPGPPQIFRNYVELSSEQTLISMSLSPVDGFQLLRVRVTSSPSPSHLSEEDAEEYQSRSETKANELSHIIDLFFDCLGIAKQMQSKLVVTSGATDFDPQLFLDGRKPSDVGFLEQRFLPDLSLVLAKVVRSVCVLSDVRPAGSFRFSTMLYPCDVDMEEYVVAVEADQNAALGRLVEWLKIVGTRCEERKIYWGGLKAGEDPMKPGKVLTWSTDEISNGKKVCAVEGRQQTVPFDQALKEGNKSRTAFITIFAKVSLFSGQTSAERFFEITNVIRFGHVLKGQIMPVTKEYDFLEVLDGCSFSYCGKTPKAMKYVKRLWERAVYLAQRNMAVEESLIMLKVLQPIFGHWVAELAQIAAHAETLHSMLQKGFKDAVLSDMEVFGASLEDMDQRMLSVRETDSDKTWVRAAASDVLETIEYLILHLPQVSKDDGGLGHLLEEAAELLDACVECTLNQWLGSITAITRPLQEDWTFPSCHLPIGATVGSSFVCSWNLRSLDGCGAAAWSDEERQQRIVDMVFQIVLHPTLHSTKRKDVLCLQGCWQKLLEQIDHQLKQTRKEFDMVCTGRDADTDCQQAIIYCKDTVVLKDFASKQLFPADRKRLFPADRKKAVAVAQFLLKDESRQLRIITAHLPVEPFGLARRALCNCVRRLHAIDPAHIPSLLLGDLSVQEQAIGPLLKHHANVPHVEFASIPYPTATFKGSLLPNRTDTIVSLSDDLKAKPLEAHEVVAGLEKHVELLKSRCLGLADWDTDGSFANMTA